MISTLVSVTGFIIFKWTFLRLLPGKSDETRPNPLPGSLPLCFKSPLGRPAERRSWFNLPTSMPEPGAVLQPSSLSPAASRRSSSALPCPDGLLP
jgi:hypothetical protein